MLSLDRILEITKEMGVAVRTHKDGKHYIGNGNGEKIEFNTDMLIKTENKKSFLNFKLKYSNVGELNISNNLYKPSNWSNSSYFLEPVKIDEANVIAA